MIFLLLVESSPRIMVSEFRINSVDVPVNDNRALIVVAHGGDTAASRHSTLNPWKRSSVPPRTQPLLCRSLSPVCRVSASTANKTLPALVGVTQGLMTPV